MNRNAKCDNYLLDRADVLNKQWKVVLADVGTACIAEPIHGAGGDENLLVALGLLCQ